MKTKTAEWDALWSRIQNDDESAFEVLVSGVKDQYAWWVYLQIGDWENVQDVLNEAFLRLWKNRKHIRTHPQHWFFRTLHNLCMDVHRKRGRKHTFLEKWRKRKESPSYESIEHVEFEHDMVRFFALLKKRLGEQEYMVFTLFALLGYSYDEIARELGISASTVRSHVHHVRKKLKTFWKEIAGEHA